MFIKFYLHSPLVKYEITIGLIMHNFMKHLYVFI